MTYKRIRNTSYLFSIVFHLILLGIFLFITFNNDYPPSEYVEVGFGTTGEGVSAGAKGTQIEDIQQSSNIEASKRSEQLASVVKEVELPKTKNAEAENVVTPSEKTDKDVKPNSNTESNKDVDETASTTSSTGRGNKGEGEGSFGYDIDFGGKGTRKIYHWEAPAYPDGVAKEIDIRLKFSILPDGTVGRILPLLKADTRLENAAINSLRQWRFEPLRSNQKQIEQTAIIVFPYRLQ